MAPLANLSREEKLGLAVAAAAHVALALALVLQDDAITPYTPPERIDVSLATEVSLEATAPDPSAQPAGAMAPEISDAPVPAPAPRAEAVEPEVRPEPPRPPVQQARPERTERAPQPQPTQRTAPPRQESPPRQQPQQASQGSRLNDDFLQGMSDSQGERGSPAREAGPAQRASIAQAVQRQLKPHWNPPSGVDVERLVTVVRFRLNEDGSLSGNPTVVGTNGQNDSNRAQVGRHQEQAVRAVRLAAPFDLPDQFYSVWRNLETNFDNRLAQ